MRARAKTRCYRPPGSPCPRSAAARSGHGVDTSPRGRQAAAEPVCIVDVGRCVSPVIVQMAQQSDRFGSRAPLAPGVTEPVAKLSPSERGLAARDLARDVTCGQALPGRRTQVGREN